MSNNLMSNEVREFVPWVVDLSAPGSHMELLVIK